MRCILMIVGLAGMACSLAGCVVVLGNESNVQYAESGKAQRWRLGITLDDVDKATASQLGLNRERTCMIESVIADSPADHAGLKRYDIITKVGSSDDAGREQVLDAIRCAKSDEEFKLTVLRGGQPLEISAKLRD